MKSDCAAKGYKVGSCRKVAHFMLVTSYETGVLIYEQFEKNEWCIFCNVPT